MTTDQIEDFERSLNRIDPIAICEALRGLDRHPLRGPEASIGTQRGDATEADVGVAIRQMPLDEIWFRVTFPADLGFGFIALFMTRQSFAGFVAALTATLRERGAELAS